MNNWIRFVNSQMTQNHPYILAGLPETVQVTKPKQI